MNRVEYSNILKVLPDWKIVNPFKGFCNEEGCAWQMNAGGHDNTGKYFECNEIEFMWTNEHGRIERVEVFNDWVNMSEFLGRIAGVSADSVDYSSYVDGLEELDKVPAKDAQADPKK